jgi:hypothetical protein
LKKPNQDFSKRSAYDPRTSKSEKLLFRQFLTLLFLFFNNGAGVGYKIWGKPNTSVPHTPYPVIVSLVCKTQLYKMMCSFKLGAHVEEQGGKQ